jgi:anthranilate phosphoribosyltransferase
MLNELLEKLEAGHGLSRGEAEDVMEELLAGRMNDDDIVRLLEALRSKGETVEELVGFATVMRRRANIAFARGAVHAEALVDTCGTGGGTVRTFNISTAAAFVVAGAGVRVAKHGNRSYTTSCGSADVLEALGVRIEVSPEDAASAIDEIGIGFFFAPAAHTAARHAAAARKRVGAATVFNLLGPLTNPAGARVQVLGVFAAKWTEPMAMALAELGTRRAFVVHADDGLDEIALSCSTQVSEVHGKSVQTYRVQPEEFGVSRAPVDSLAGGNAEQNARIILEVLGGARGPRRDVVIANASAALVAAGRASDFREGAALAAQAIDSGAAREKLEALINFTRR